MNAWRITKNGKTNLDGEESRADGGRWHRAGRPLVYAASSCALAVLEFLAHLEGDPGKLCALEIAIPDDMRQDCILPEHLPQDWREPRHEHCCRTGEEWLALPFPQRGPVLLVPSAVVPLENNIIIDPFHPESSRVQVKKVHHFDLDKRLIT